MMAFETKVSRFQSNRKKARINSLGVNEEAKAMPNIIAVLKTLLAWRDEDEDTVEHMRFVYEHNLKSNADMLPKVHFGIEAE